MVALTWLKGLRERAGRKPERRSRDNHGRSAVPLHVDLQHLEQRTLLTSTIQFTGDGLLRILADGDETIKIGEDASVPGQLDVQVDGVSATNLPTALSTSQVMSIDIIAGAGDNVIDLSGVNVALFSGLTGTGSTISIVGGQGDDQITGASDITTNISGGDGNDVINGGSAGDVLAGNDGNDSITGGMGDDTVNAGDGSDVVTGDEGDDSILGDDGDDSLTGGVGDDFINAGDGRDSVLGGAGNDTINGMAGNDTLDGGDDADSLLGGSDEDSILGAAGDDILHGNSGDDTLESGDGNDRVFGQAGRDSVNGGSGTDFINGGSGNDTLNGNAESDTIIGGSGGDAIQGGSGDDRVRGQGGPDTILGNAGQDFLDGGTGDDGIAAADPSVSIQSTLLVNPEGDPTSPQSAVLTLTLSSATLLPVTVDFTTVEGSALAGSDFVATSGTVTIPAGVTSQTLTIPIVGDLVQEPAPDETFTVVLSNPQGLTIQNGTSTVSIRDDDVPAFSIDDVTIMEPGDATDVVFAIDVSGSASSVFTGATVGDVNGDGQPNTIIDVELDSLITYNNTVLAVNAPMSRVSLITFFSTNSSVGRVEMDPAAGYVPFTMNLTTTPLADVDGNGINDVEDILRNVPSFTLPFGGTGGSVLSNANQTFIDLATPPNDGLVIVLSDFAIGNASAMELAVLTSAGRRVRAFEVSNFSFGFSATASYDPNFVVVNDPQDLSDELSMVAVGGVTPFTVTLDQPAVGATSVDFNTVDGTAIAGVDYVAQSDTLVFPPGTTSQTIPVSVFNDGIVEPNETFSVVLSNPSAGSRIEDGTGVATIIDQGASMTPASFSGSASVSLGAVGSPSTSFIPPLSLGTTTSGNVICETVIGGRGRDTLLGSDVADFIDGDDGRDLIFGNAGDDTILGGAGMDTIFGGLGADTIDGQGGDDLIDGGLGEDTMIWNGQPDGDDTVIGADGQDQAQVQATDAANTLVVGQSSTGELVVTEGTATLTVDETVATVLVSGNNGDDTITLGDLRQVGRISLVVDGGIGDDLIDASAANIGNVRLELRGGEGTDTVRGSESAERLSGGDGDDSIVAGGGDDTVDGDAGADVIDGGSGDDSIRGGADDDTIDGSEGDDTVDGGLDSDVIRGGDGDDSLRGNFGDDNLNGNSGSDTLLGQSGQDTLSGGSGSDLLNGGRNNDRINGQSGNDSILGDHGDDSIDGGGGNDEILGGDGDDTINGGNGADGIDGGNGSDLLQGNAGNDVIRGGDGDDTIRGGGGADTMLGDQGIDVLNGNGGNDLGQTGEGGDPAPTATETIDEQFTLTLKLLDRLDAM